MSTARDGSRGVRHLVGDVQRYGLLSAAAIVERYVEMVDDALAADARPKPGAAQERGGPTVPDGADRLAAAGTRLLDTLAGLVTRGVGPGGAPGTERLVLPTTGPGGRSEISLWVHNPTGAPVAGLDLRVSSLACPTGSTIPTSAITLSPAHVDLVAAAGRHEVRLRVDVPPDQPEGHYHGLVLSSAAPTEPLALRLEVHRTTGRHP